MPESFALSRNYPNPFNGGTRMRFSLPRDTGVTIRVVNLLGQPVKTLARGEYEAGVHRIDWDGTDERGQQVVAGIYLVQMRAGSFSATRRIVYVR